MMKIALVIALCAPLAAACCNSKESSSAPSSSAETKSNPTAPSADSKTTDVDLKPLPLTIRVPKDGMGAMDMSVGDKKSVTVDIGEGESLNIQPMTEKDINEVKKGFKSDTILFPFKKFAREDANGFVVQFEADGKKVGFIGVAIKEVGGKKYVCKTTGLEGVKSVEAADKNLKACDNLKAK
jgi:hypothetical protein